MMRLLIPDSPFMGIFTLLYIAFFLLIWITGITVVLKNKNMSLGDKIVWVLLILMFNAFALAAFMF